MAPIDGAFDVDREHRREAEQRGGDREHAGAAADVEQRAGLELLQQLEAELRRRVRAGAERAAGVDDDGERVVRRLSHGGPIQSRPTRTGRWKVAPAVLPAVLDVGGVAHPEDVPEALLARRVGVGHQLDAAPLLDLLEALGEELDHHRAGLLGAVAADLHRDAPEPAQRNALFSFSKKLSSWR